MRLVYNEVYVGETPPPPDGDATFCGVPLNTGTLECNSPLFGSTVYIKSKVPVVGLAGVNFLEVRAYSTQNLTKFATIAKATATDPTEPLKVASSSFKSGLELSQQRKQGSRSNLQHQWRRTSRDKSLLQGP